MNLSKSFPSSSFRASAIVVATHSLPDPQTVGTEPFIPLRGVSWQTYQALMADVGGDRSLQVYQLIEGDYQLVPSSLAFPTLPIAEIPNFIEQSKTTGQRTAVCAFRKRMREILEN